MPVIMGMERSRGMSSWARDFSSMQFIVASRLAIILLVSRALVAVPVTWQRLSISLRSVKADLTVEQFGECICYFSRQ